MKTNKIYLDITDHSEHEVQAIYEGLEPEGFTVTMKHCSDMLWLVAKRGRA